MEYLLYILPVLFIVYLFYSFESKVSSKEYPYKSSKEQRILDDNLGWLKKRWDNAFKNIEVDNNTDVPDWFFDPVTEEQLRYIDELGLTISQGELTKGVASDLIGLFHPAEEDEKEILRFFKIPLTGMNQTKARAEIDKIFSGQSNVELWKNRPASIMQKEFYKYFGIKPPKRLTQDAAQVFIPQYIKSLNKENDQDSEEWFQYIDLYDEINDPNFREDYELKKISLPLYRSVINQLREGGMTMTELSEDIDFVIGKIIEIKPEIQIT